MKISQKLYVRVALSIAVVALLVSFATSFFSYVSGLEEKRATNYSLVEQLAQTMQTTAAISAYLADVELGTEIMNGLLGNDLVKGVSLSGKPDMMIIQGEVRGEPEKISIKLMHPFIPGNQIGLLTLYPDDVYIQHQAQSASKKEVFLMMLHSFIIIFFVSIVVHQRLSRPLQKLTDEFAKIDPRMPQTMQMLGVKKGKKDEISRMIMGINSLMRELQLTINNERELRTKTQELETRFRLIFEQASAGICLINEENIITTYNPAFEAHFIEQGQTEIPSLNFPVLLNDVDKLPELLQVIRNKEDDVEQLTLDVEYTVGQKTKWIHCLFAKLTEQRDSVGKNQDILIEVIVHDVTERAEKEFQTRFEADHDALTQLFNRRAGERELKKALSDGIEKDNQLVLMMVDLDKFKPVNDNFGHDAGDKVLIEVGRRIKSRFGSTADICIRWGGDEFVIARQVDSFDRENFLSQAQDMLDGIEQPIQLNEEEVCHISASIGIVIGPQDGKVLEELMIHADQTMYQVKEHGRGHVAFFKKA
ncbi:sensor domain-containing diguanylate cyclase [Marinomonas transparens]|uniref:Sensor domain-containing diguanylate cyclase n=1 Tax=Marinomonas transparens TaxID=2795388 RepID=A0A934MY46_9GAMM|nr:sensor domain-containing diguanylate cyclase [Marinomonas transparens]MBJ7540024.1 sensor domain-containing diguanylate cyclase [Marinomonas transparens]